VETTSLHTNPNCICCGPEHPVNAGIAFRMVDGELQGTAHVDHRHEGERGVVHGGFLAVILDEALGGTARHVVGRTAVTANLNVDFRAPVVLPAALRVHAAVDRVDGRKVHVRGSIHHDDTLVAEATGLWIVVPEEHFSGRGVPVPDLTDAEAAAAARESAG
jgi:uncharacterized protein (TIGR00369 family)